MKKMKKKENKNPHSPVISIKIDTISFLLTFSLKTNIFSIYIYIYIFIIKAVGRGQINWPHHGRFNKT